MSTTKDRLKALALRLRTSASLYREKGNTQDRYACYIEVLAEAPEEGAKEGLELLVAKMPSWFAN